MADNDDFDLDGMFGAARRDAARMPDDLTSRMLADASEIQGARATDMSATPSEAGRGILRQVLAAIGGWPAMGGMVAACAAGVWIGLAPPDFLPDPTNLMTTTQNDVDVLDAYSLSSLYLEDG